MALSSIYRELRLTGKYIKSTLLPIFSRHLQKTNVSQFLLSKRAYSQMAVVGALMPLIVPLKIEKEFLYYIVIRYPISGSGYSVAFLFTANDSLSPLRRFLTFLKTSILITAPQKVTIDVRLNWLMLCRVFILEVRYNGIASMWRGLERHKRNQALRRRMMAVLKSMKWEGSSSNFRIKLSAFIANNEYNAITASFTNRRVDRILYILVNDVEFDYINNISRISLNVGRMRPEERSRRQRKLMIMIQFSNSLQQRMSHESSLSKRCHCRLYLPGLL
ncbi:hypothetical protein BDF20DRAFT_838332 [Mycotypha africana]|uniref:uncharacterized protein n=1 Tax=Mycotypha africana TaxID=64632 RepID=UPI0023008441|nr:uncharacterized protein BDF20DRAFT_838332 [Mycotypha africana]KAI8969907.1 hypothetical protein BDF20DRAFT_838332 [Mycotypha africana]